jgi:hypothetical protein
MINGHIKIGYIQINIKNIKNIKNINFKKYIKYIYILKTLIQNRCLLNKLHLYNIINGNKSS